jgi:hypothetical protein
VVHPAGFFAFECTFSPRANRRVMALSSGQSRPLIRGETAMAVASTGLSKYEKPGGELGGRSARVPPAPRDPLLVTINETKRLTGLGRTSIYKLVDEKKLTLKKVGRRSLIVFASILDLIEENEETAT